MMVTVSAGKMGNDHHKKGVCDFFGGVEEFKKLLFDAAARAGYGKIRQVVFIGDGSHWIWNMCEELFPDAVQIWTIII